MGIGIVNAATLEIKENIDYTKVNAVSKPLPSTPNKVTVTEFFSYACIHCSLLEPSLIKWYANSKNVVLQRIQVVWETNFSGYAKINATAQLLNLSPAFIQKVFDATLKDKIILEDQSKLKKFLDNQKLVDPKKFMATYNSFTVNSKPQEYAQYTAAFNITGTPTFVIGNKYLTKPAQPKRLIQVIQALVIKVKKEQNIK